MDKYELSLAFTINKQGSDAKFCDGTINYHNLGYDDLLGTEGGVMIALLKLGFAAAQAKGLSVEPIKAALGLK